MVADHLSVALTAAGVADVADLRARFRQGLSVASPDFIADPDRLAALAGERGATTIVSGKYYRSGNPLVLYATIRGVERSKEVLRFASDSGPLTDPGQALPRLQQQLLGVIASLRDVRMTAATSVATRTPVHAEVPARRTRSLSARQGRTLRATSPHAFASAKNGASSSVKGVVAPFGCHVSVSVTMNGCSMPGVHI